MKSLDFPFKLIYLDLVSWQQGRWSRSPAELVQSLEYLFQDLLTLEVPHNESILKLEN